MAISLTLVGKKRLQGISRDLSRKMDRHSIQTEITKKKLKSDESYNRWKGVGRWEDDEVIAKFSMADHFFR